MAIKTDKDGHPIPDGKGKRWWTRLTPNERRLHTDWRFDAGHKNSDVMAALGLSVGTVSGIKRIWRERKEVSGGTAGAPAPTPPKPPEPPAPEPQPPIPPAPIPSPAPSEPKKERVEPVSRTLAASEKTSCVHKDEKGRRCGYAPLPDSTSCGRPGHDK